MLLLVRTFVVETFRVPTSSMAPTLRAGDRVVVDKLTLRFRAPHRGELVVFTSPEDGTLLLKRVVGVGADVVAITDGTLRVNGAPVHESYVDRDSVDSTYFGPVRVRGGAVFVMGDRRADSIDSRTFGPVELGRIVGLVHGRL